MRYGTFKYGQAKYGAVPVDTQLWAILVDWNGDGLYDYYNEADHLTGMRVTRGRRNLLNASGTGFEPVGIGALSLTLDNQDGRYHPFNAKSPIYPYVRPGVKIRVLTRLPESGDEHAVFTGQIDDIVPISGGYERVRISARDGASWLDVQEVTLQIQQDKTPAELIATMLAAAAWPWGSNLESSSDIVPWFWAPAGSSVFEILDELASVHLGVFFIAADGSARFYNRNHGFTASKYRLEQDQIAADILTRSPWETIRNQVSVISHPRTAQATTVVWTLYDKPSIEAGQTFEVWGTFMANGEEMPISGYTTPVGGTDFLVNTKPDGTGTDLTSSCTLTITAYANRARFQLKNNSAQNGYITLMQLRGTPLAKTTALAEVSDPTSIGLYGPRSLVIDSVFLQDSSLISDLAGALMLLLKEAQIYPTIRIVQRPELQYTVDLFDAIDLIIDKLGVADTYQIGQIEHEWLSETGQATATTLVLELINNAPGTVWTFPTQIGIDSIFAF